MQTTSPRPRGRKPASSRETIEEAAIELFCERGYAATSVTDIAQRAGVSRASFFNYVDGKADVLWGPVVRELERVSAALARAEEAEPASASGRAPAHPHSSPFARAIEIVRTAVVALAEEFPASSIPPALTQAELMGTREACAETGMAVLLEQVGALRVTLARLDPKGSRGAHAAFAGALAGAVVAAADGWVRAGTGRGSLAERIRPAIDPVCAGFVEWRA